MSNLQIRPAAKSAPLVRNWIPGPLPGIWTKDKEEVLNKCIQEKQSIYVWIRMRSYNYLFTKRGALNCAALLTLLHQPLPPPNSNLLASAQGVRALAFKMAGILRRNTN